MEDFKSSYSSSAQTARFTNRMEFNKKTELGSKDISRPSPSFIVHHAHFERYKSASGQTILVCTYYMVINIFRVNNTTKASTPHAEVELTWMLRANKRYDNSKNPVGIPLSHVFYYSYRILLEQSPFPLS